MGVGTKVKHLTMCHEFNDSKNFTNKCYELWSKLHIVIASESRE